MKRFVIALFLVFAWVASPPRVRRRSDSLALLVKTLLRTEDPNIQAAMLGGMLDGLAGRRGVPEPDGWHVLKTKLETNDRLRELTMRLSQIFGDQGAIEQALAIIHDDDAKPGTRRTALRALLSQQNRQASSQLETLLDDPVLGTDAIRGYASVENAAAPSVLLQRYPELNPERKRAVVETLSSRQRYANALVGAIRLGDVPRADIPVHVARSLQLLLGDRFVKVFGEVRDLAEDRGKQLAKYKALCSEEAIAKANVSRGRAVFQKTCASCHLLYGTGGKIGPDLTGSNRANLDYILLNSVDPSYDVPDGYKMEIIQTFDGRLINGVIAEEDARRVILKTVEQPRLVIAKNDIEARKTSSKSMMPDGQLDQMKPQEVVDLIKYLRTTDQVELPSES